jgi:hypothetical protein
MQLLRNGGIHMTEITTNETQQVDGGGYREGDCTTGTEIAYCVPVGPSASDPNRTRPR